MIEATQKWLNETYTGKTGWEPVPEDGKTGWTTVYALLYAFQIENGSTTPSTNIGPWTISKLQEVGMLHEDADAKPNNIVKILQGTLWCKGYPADGISGIFGEQTAAGVKSLKSDIGIKNPDSQITLLLWYTLFSMEQYVLVPGGNSGIREFQQWFNNNYVAYRERYVPCDGLAGRELYTCFIYMLQMEEGYDASTATGEFGSSTFTKCPSLSSALDSQKYPVTIRCVKMALWLNGFPSIGFDSSSALDANTFELVHDYNAFMILPDKGNVITPGTIKSLFTSNGDTSRPCDACDTSKPINQARAEVLIGNNIKCVGRYITPGILNGENKQVTIDEMEVLKSNDIAMVPIYQSSGDTPAYFTEAQGISDAVDAYGYATDLSLPGNSTIYFAVDYDILGGDIPSTVIPYFKGVLNTLQGKGTYRPGVYGTRNVCTQVINAGYAVSAYVSDMSTGYSGNMGFPMPKNWAFDQFYETTINYKGMGLDIDKVAMNHTDLGVYMETSQTTALRKMSEDVLDSFNLRPLMMNASFELNKKITLIEAPVKVELLASASYSTEVDDADFKLTGHLNPNGTVTSSVSADIDSISASFKPSAEQKSQISLTYTAMIEKFPDGTEFYIKVAYANGGLTYKFIVNIPKAYDYHGNSYGGSIEVDVTFYSNQLPTGYSPAFDFVYNYDRNEAFASFGGLLYEVNTQTEMVQDGAHLVLKAIFVVGLMALISPALARFSLAIIS